MKEYLEEDQKLILHAMENKLLALLVIDINTDEFEVIYSDGGYRRFDNRHRGVDFFTAWKKIGLFQMIEPDRERLEKEISKDNLLEKTASGTDYITTCRFFVAGRPAVCRIKVRRDVLEKDTLTMSIRDIDEDTRHEQKRMSEMEELLRRESTYRNAILANSAGFMEVNLSKNCIITKIYDKREEWMPTELSIPELGDPVPYDEFEKWWSSHMLLSDQEEFLSFSNCAYLISCFKNKEQIASIECKARTVHGGISVCRETYYLSQDQLTGDIMAICVLYDLTQQQKRERDMQQLQETLKQMRMKNFTSQMHPHFLYNALSSIREIVLVDPEYGADMLYDFTTHLRASIRAMGSDELIPFSQELENIKAYVNIEKMRFGDKLTVVYDIEAADFDIIPLSIQPIVENAIKHGIYEKNTDDGRVLIRTRELDDSWQVCVEDNGIGFDPENIKRQVMAGKRDSTGLYNLIFRLENMMNASVQINSRRGEGTKVEIMIPKRQKT